MVTGRAAFRLAVVALVFTILARAAMHADFPTACRIWWRDFPCYPAAERAYHEDGQRALEAMLQAGSISYEEAREFGLRDAEGLTMYDSLRAAAKGGTP